VTFRCTGKVQRRLRLTPARLAPPPATPDATEWHCNVLTLARRPSYLVTHSLSLFTVLFPAAGAASPVALAAAVRQQIREALARNGYRPAEAARILDAGPDQFCKATDRSVLGSMNDFANMADWAAHDHQSADPALLALTADEQMNGAPMSMLGMDSPLDVLHLLLRPQGCA
jgi:hypothetical protein